MIFARRVTNTLLLWWRFQPAEDITMHVVPRKHFFMAPFVTPSTVWCILRFPWVLDVKQIFNIFAFQFGETTCTYCVCLLFAWALLSNRHACLYSYQCTTSEDFIQDSLKRLLLNRKDVYMWVKDGFHKGWST